MHTQLEADIYIYIYISKNLGGFFILKGFALADVADTISEALYSVNKYCGLPRACFLYQIPPVTLLRASWSCVSHILSQSQARVSAGEKAERQKQKGGKNKVNFGISS